MAENWCTYGSNSGTIQNIPYAKENFRMANYWRVVEPTADNEG